MRRNRFTPPAASPPISGCRHDCGVRTSATYEWHWHGHTDGPCYAQLSTYLSMSMGGAGFSASYGHVYVHDL